MFHGVRKISRKVFPRGNRPTARAKVRWRWKKVNIKIQNSKLTNNHSMQYKHTIVSSWLYWQFAFGIHLGRAFANNDGKNKWLRLSIICRVFENFEITPMKKMINTDFKSFI
jgi:hypothetical protein